MASDDSLFGQLVNKTPVPDSECWGKPKDFVEKLKSWLGIALTKPNNAQLIVSGYETPGSDATNNMWASFDNNKNFLGWYTFIKNQWRKAYTLPPNPLQRCFNPTPSQPPSIPDGWKLANGTVPGTPDLTSEFTGTAPNYVTFWLVYVGY